MNIFKRLFNTPFFDKYKWLLIPSIPLLFFGFLVAFIFSPQPSPQKSNPLPSPFPTIKQSNDIVIPTIDVNSNSAKNIHSLEEQDIEGVKNTEKLPGGLVKYSFDSPNASRPNITITENNMIVFDRKVRPQDFGEKISDYTDTLGSPEKTVNGSNFYGPTAQIYIYASNGLAIIADSQTQEVLEQQTFPPMSVTEYIQTYGNDN